MATYSQLQRSDLTAFDKEATALVLEAMDYDWLGRISTKGHAILRAPDGETTISISRDSLRGRSGRNSRAEFNRWLSESTKPEVEASPEVEPRASEPAPEPEGEVGGIEHILEPEIETVTGVRCALCGKEFPSLMSLGSHKRKHTLASKSKIECPICGRHFSVLGKHLGDMHGTKPHQVFSQSGLRGLRSWAEKQEQGVDHGTIALNALASLVEENEDLREQVAGLEAQLAKIKKALS